MKCGVAPYHVYLVSSSVARWGNKFIYRRHYELRRVHSNLTRTSSMGIPRQFIAKFVGLTSARLVRNDNLRQ